MAVGFITYMPLIDPNIYSPPLVSKYEFTENSMLFKYFFTFINCSSLNSKQFIPEFVFIHILSLNGIML